jgi:hypothetical protein
MEGELAGIHDTVKCSCGAELRLDVQHSAAGYYLGYWCEECGPWSRETDYFKTRKDAEKALELEGFGHLRTTEYRGR